MAAVNQAFEELISQYRQRLSELQQKIDDQNSELKGLVAAREVASGASARLIDELIAGGEKRLNKNKSKFSDLTLELRGILIARDGIVPPGSPNIPSGRRVRRISDEWRSILQHIRKFGESGATLNDIHGFIRDEGFKIKEAAVRSQLSIYSKPDKDYLKSMGQGNYQITERGCALLDRAIDED